MQLRNYFYIDALIKIIGQYFSGLSNLLQTSLYKVLYRAKTDYNTNQKVKLLTKIELLNTLALLA